MARAVVPNQVTILTIHRWEVTLEKVCPVSLGRCSASVFLSEHCLLPETGIKTGTDSTPSDLQ